MIETSILYFVAKPVTFKAFLMPAHSKKNILCCDAANRHSRVYHQTYTHIGNKYLGIKSLNGSQNSCSFTFQMCQTVTTDFKSFTGVSQGKKKKNLSSMGDPGLGRSPWRRVWQPAPVFLPGESHGQRSLTGYNPQGCKESDRTEQLTLSKA